MGLVYKRSTKRDATKYARTPGMVPNPGVAALSVINPGTPPRKRRTSRTSRKPASKKRRRTSRRATKNPYQWVEGVTDRRGRRRRKLPKRTTGSYKSQRRAESSGKRRATDRSRLYVVDDLGNIMCPVDPVNRETKMKRNRGVRGNDAATNKAIMAAAGMGARTPVKRTKQTSKKTSAKAKTSRKSATRRRARPKLSRRRVFLTGIPEIDRQLKAGKMPVMVQIPKKGKFGRPRTTAFVSPHYTRSMRGLHKKVSKKRPRYRRRKPVDVSFWSGEEDFESMTKKAMLAYAAGEGVFIDPKLSKADLVGVMEDTFGTTAAAGRIPGGWVAANRGRRRTSRKRTSKRRTSRRKAPKRRASKRRTSKRTSRRRTTRRNPRRRTTRRNPRRRTTRRRTSRRRTTRRNPRRRTSQRRTSRRRSSRGRTSRRTSRRGKYGVRMLNNPRAVMPRRKRRGAKRAGRSLYRYTALGPKASKRRKSRSVPVLLAPQIVEYAELHRIDPLAAYRRKKKKTSRTSVAANRRRGRRRRTSMRKNARRRTTRRNRTTANKRRRTSRRRTSKRRTSKRRTKRRTRRNPGMGMAALRPRALWSDVGRPVIAGGLGFLGARALGSGMQGIAPLQGAIGDPWSRALGNTAGILATLVASAKVKMIRQNRGPLIVGMGIALLDNVISALGGEGGPLSFLSGGNVYSAGLLGSYVDIANAGSPYNGMMGEYVDYSPVNGMGAYVTSGRDAMMGEYVEQGVSGMGTYAEGIDPSDAATIEGMIDMAESQAAAGLYEAAAGVGVYEAAAGVGVYEALAGNNQGWRGPTFGSRMTAYSRSRVPEVSTLQPPMPARPITRDLPVEIPITESLATPEGRGHAGGIFGANLFASMAAC